jgi:hypothetical protein
VAGLSERRKSGASYMYCHSCGASLPKEVSFCYNCGNLTPGQNSESEELQNALTLTPAPKPYDPYTSQSPTFYGSQTSVGGLQNPYAPLPPPRHRRIPPGFLKGLFTGLLMMILQGMRKGDVERQVALIAKLFGMLA